MKAGIFKGAKSIGVTEKETPVLNAGEALVKVSYAGICGTDMMIYSGMHPRAKASLTFGHEFSGTIASVNGNSTWKKGDRVFVQPLISCGSCEACRNGQEQVCRNLQYIGIDRDGGFAEYAAVPLSNLISIPDHVTDKEAALIEPLAIAVHTVRRSLLKLGDTVTILGAGPIGLLIGLVAKQAGAEKIYISDVSSLRLQTAKGMGFETVDAREEDIVQEVLQHTNQLGSDVVFEVAGNQITANQMMDCIKFQGQIVVVSVYKKPPTLNLAAMHFRELGLITTRCYQQKDFSTAIDLLSKGVVQLEPLVSHTLPLDELEAGFALMENPDHSLKILFQP